MVCSIGYEGPIFHKNGSARGVYHLKIRGDRGVPFMDNTPRVEVQWDIYVQCGRHICSGVYAYYEKDVY